MAKKKVVGKKKKKPMPLEEWEQKQTFIWIFKWEADYPELKMANSSLNGVRMTPGSAVKQKKLGMRKGFPDINLPCWDLKKQYPGLYIELKRRGKVNTVRPDQKRWAAMLEKQGYFTCVCEGFHEAIDIIADWMGMSEKERWSKEPDGKRPGGIL